MSGQEHGFKAEVQQLLNLMIHSVYSDREVFLRELVSNAADALDKARFLSLTQPDLRPVEGEPGIRVVTGEGTIAIEDDGIGMTEAEAVQNLGTIAHSGTRAFLDAAKQAGNAPPSLIGQFGLGFYSAFMVAEEVVVETLSAQPDSKPVRWMSRGEGRFEISEGTRTQRGTRIELKLREDAKEFAEGWRLEGIVKKHSNFLPWAIEVNGTQANAARALWLDPPSQVTDEAANQFYQEIGMDWQDPALRVHLAVDSPIQYHALLFVPAARPYDLFHPEAPRGPRLYARRVLIEEHARELLPDWLRFVRGVVDSEDIPLNVSREMVQKTPVVRKIREALVKRVLRDLGKLAESDAVKFDGVWKEFGVLLKEGYYHDKAAFGEQLLPLLRFRRLGGEESDVIGLQAYKAAMPEGQEAFWYLAAESRTAALASPHVEIFRKRGWDVLILTDPVDEWLVQALTEFDGTPLKSVARGDLQLEDDGTGEETDLSGLAPWVKEILGEGVAAVRESSRLTDSACVLVDEDKGISSNMERILKQVNQDAPAAKRVLELNPRHPLIKNLEAMRSQGKTGEAEPIARLLLDEALLMEGTVKEPAAMGRRLADLLLRATDQALGPR
ncbi:MAG: molecular chaperone HtpG [Deltaproteobacteria bacterium]|nr:molecular chaperone HtpG [Deltaproteobacteria bacterium]